MQRFFFTQHKIMITTKKRTEGYHYFFFGSVIPDDTYEFPAQFIFIQKLLLFLSFMFCFLGTIYLSIKMYKKIKQKNKSNLISDDEKKVSFKTFKVTFNLVRKCLLYVFI